MSESFEDSAAFKTFLYCPVPGLDVVAGLAVLAATEVAKSCADSAQEALKDTLSTAASQAFAEGEAALQRQLAPVVSGLASISSALGSIVSPNSER